MSLARLEAGNRNANQRGIETLRFPRGSCRMGQAASGNQESNNVGDENQGRGLYVRKIRLHLGTLTAADTEPLSGTFSFHEKPRVCRYMVRT